MDLPLPSATNGIAPFVPSRDVSVASLRRLVRAIQDLSRVRRISEIQEIVRLAARELTGADGATFVLREAEHCHYVDENAIAPLWKGQRFPLHACVSGWVIRNRQVAVIPDIHEDPRVPIDAYRRTFVKSMVMVPIRGADPIGAIGNYWSARYDVSADEVQLLQALADTTSVALENVRVYEELEQRVRDRTLQLEHANEELQSFASSVSHDLRAPLAVISGYADLLDHLAGARLDEKSRGILQQIPRQVTRMSALIDDLLRLARIRQAPLQFGPLDLCPIAQEILHDLAQAQPERRVEWVVAPRLPAHGDAPLVRILLENLLSNAWKYTGRVSLARIEVGYTQTSAGEEAFFVRDNGAGFNPEHASRLFHPFQRLHSATEFAGTGVGLTIAARIVEKHGGRVWAEGAPGGGATFYFTLSHP